MLPYGIQPKRAHKTHDVSKCRECAERKQPIKKRARQIGMMEFSEELARMA